MRAYRHAVEEHYRFFSYGDAMFLYPRADAEARHGMNFELLGTDGGARRGRLASRAARWRRRRSCPWAPTGRSRP